MQLSYIEIAVKLALGLLSLVIVINISGKGNLAPTSASDQVQNYVLGGIIKKGKIDIEATRKAGLTAQDVAFKLRTQGVYSIQKVKRAVLEQNGQLIIIQQGEENPKYPVITDGTIQHSTLESIDKTEEWLLEELKDMGYKNASDIFIAEYDKGQLHIVEY